MKYFFLLPFFIAFSCNKQPAKQTTPAFYFWKSSFDLSSKESEALRKHSIKKLYVKYFDVDWDEQTHQIIPKAVLQIGQNLPDSSLQIIPVIYLTNRTFQHLSFSEIDILSSRILLKINELNTILKINNTELQFDCDWSKSTRQKYFGFLKSLKSKLQKPTILSATIRLHQIKFPNQTGIPPVERGMLMFYNMADWRAIKTQNSILDLPTANLYLNKIADYPLALDVVLPIYSQTIIYRNEHFLTFINELRADDFKQKSFIKHHDDNLYQIMQDTTCWNITFRKGDVLRAEECSMKNLLISSEILHDKIQNKKLTFALYHLNTQSLVHYSHDQIQQIFQSFH